ncbi:MAG TPA: SpoIVB peptidase S55 domain-containing protein [bacterium]|nr:SpoIVB peptidase S55 domain-containing protein [bacterium]
MVKKTIITAVLAVVMIASAARAVDIMKVDDIRPGMKGYGLTVFSGSEPERFDVEIIAVIKKWSTGNDLILGRVSGHNLEFTGVTSGMSGSPVYIDGKLIGAVAYGWSWTKEPVAGIQPIKHMLELWEKPAAGGGQVSGTRGSLPEPLLFKRTGDMRETISKLEGRPKRASMKASAGSLGEIELEQIKTPLMISGTGEMGMDVLGDLLGAYNIVPVAGGGDADVPDGPGVDSLKAGGVVGSPLMRGDLRAGAIGTVTLREDDRLLAFGHSFFGEGPNRIPLSGGEIYHFLANLQFSFKMGAVGRVLGTIVDDRLSAISGKIGDMPEYFPLSIEYENADTGEKREFKMEVAQLKQTDSSMVMTAMVKSAVQFPMPQESTVRMVMDGRLKDYPRPFHYENMYVEPPDYAVYGPLLYLFDLLYNPYRDTSVAELKIKMIVEKKRKLSGIIGASFAASTFHAGDVVKAYLRTKDYNEVEGVEEISFRIPKDVPPGLLTVEIEGGGSMSGMPTEVLPEDFDGMFDILLDWIPQNRISVKFVYEENALAVRGRELKALPGSVGNTFDIGYDAKRKPFNRYERELIETDKVMFGKAIMSMNIEKEFQP